MSYKRSTSVLFSNNRSHWSSASTWCGLLALDRTIDAAVFVYWWVRAASVWKRTRKSACMTGRKGHLHRTDSSSSTQQNKEDILPTKHTLPPTAPHIHPGALQQWREELLPVFPPTWKEPSAVRIIFIFQPNVKSWHGHQCSFFLWWFTHSSTASDVNRNKGGTPVQRWILQDRHISLKLNVCWMKTLHYPASYSSSL